MLNKNIYKKVIICLIAVISAIICFSTKESKAASATVNGQTWYYTLSGGNATNVYTTSTVNGVLTIPDTIASYPVTSIGTGSRNVIYKTSTTSNTTVTSVIIPSTVTKINNYAFSRMTKLTSVSGWDNVTTMGNYVFQYCTGLTEVILPSSLLTLGSSEFYGCTNLNKVNFSESLTSIGSTAFFNCKGLTGDLVIPAGISTIGTNAFQNCTGLNGNLIINSSKLIAIPNYAFDGCTNLKKIILPSTVKSVGSYSFQGQKDIWVDDVEGNITFASNFGGTNIPYVHYKGDKHTVNVNLIEGIKAINKATGEEFVNGEYDCESSINIELQIQDGYTYDGLVVLKTTDGEYTNSESISESLSDKEITIDNLLRNVTITTKNLSAGLDLSLRQYIDNINGNEFDVVRNPVVITSTATLRYLHTKYPVIVKNGDIITYKIKVYNEGTAQGSVDEITEHLPEGIEFITDNEKNKLYNWVVSEDGKTLTTDYYKEQSLFAYTGIGFPDSKTLELVCRVTATQDESKVVRLTNIAEITKQSSVDADSTPNNAIVTNLDKYKYDESIESNSVSYVEGQEDDDDFESVVILRKIPITYSIKISKVDNLTYELINGAKFDLLDKEGNVLQSEVIVKNGQLVFEPITTYDGGIDTYYIRETLSPEGYKPMVEDTIKVEIIKTIINQVAESYKIEVVCDLLESYINTNIDESQLIPIYTADQLSKMGSGNVVIIDGKEYTFGIDKNYRLMNDIDLAGSEWTPIKKCLTGIFDGNNKKITGLTITDKNVKKAALFATFSGVIENLNMESVNIKIDLSDEIKNIEESLLDSDEIKIELQKLQDSYNVSALVADMKGGAILNSTVDGIISSDSNNIGGFVGYSESGYLLVFKNCTNNANVSTTSYNVGGLVGNSLSALTIKSSTNNGNVTAGTYNAGGLVGYEEASEYTATSTKIEYDETNSIINLIVGNAKTSGYYNIKLSNLDKETEKLINGSKFALYDTNKNTVSGLEEIILENGSITLDKTKIESSGTDIYYLKQLSAPDGYNIISEYLKIEIIKKWDGKVSEFKVSVINEDESNDEVDNSDENNSKENITVSTGNNCTYTKTDGVSWLVNKVAVTNSKNTGIVTAGKTNAAGIIGKTNCIVDIESSNNDGKIISCGNAAGILAEAEKKDDDTNMYIYKCVNNGEIAQDEMSPSLYGANISGIVSYTKVKSSIIENTNNGVITSNDGIATGIIANIENELIVNNCNNTAEITSNQMAGGVVGKFINRAEKVTIKNSSNTGSITASEHMSGIIVFADTEILKVEDCKSKDADYTTTSNGIIGGIVGQTVSDTEINNCSIENSTITGNGDSAAGILGYAGSIPVGYENYVFICHSPTMVNVTDCTAKKVKLNGSAEMKAAIVAELIDVYSGGIREANIVNCFADEITMTRESGGMTVNDAIIVAHSQNVTNLNIDNCDASNSNINSINGGSCNSGVIIGLIMQNSQTNGSNIIKNCDVDNVNSTINSSEHFGGFIGAILGSNGIFESPVSISGCTFKNSTIKSLNTGHIHVSCGIGQIYSKVNVEIYDCDVSDTSIESNTVGDEFNSTSAIIGNTIVKSLRIYDCDVKNTEIKAKSGKASGISADSNVTSISSDGLDTFIIKNCNFIDSNVYGLNEEKNGGTKESSAIAAQIIGSNGTLKDCNVKSTNAETPIQITGGYFIGAISGYAETGIITADNVNASNVNVETMGANISGGMYGVVKQVKTINSEYNNITITNNNTAGGFIGYSTTYQDANTFDNCKFNKINVNSKTGSYNTGAIIGMGSVKSQNSTYENLTVNSELQNNSNLGGISGFSSEFSMNNDIVKNVNLTNNGGTLYVAGLSGSVGKAYVDNVNVSNVTISTPAPCGGLFGVGEIHVNTLDSDNKVKLTDVELHNTQEPGSYNAYGAAGVEFIAQYGDIKNVTVDGLKITSLANKIRAGGIIGTGAPLIDNCIVNNANISNSFVADTVEESDCQIGGIAGIFERNTISNSNVLNSTIKANAACIGGLVGGCTYNVTNCNVENVEITGNGKNYVGGAIGHDNDITANGIKIEKINVINTNISNSGGSTGGIAGFCKGSVLSSNFTNSSITSVGENSMGVGGIVGQGFNIKESDISAYTKVVGCTVTDSKISGNIAVGGIAGVAVPEITSCKVIGTKNDMLVSKLELTNKTVEVQNNTVESKSEVIEEEQNNIEVKNEKDNVIKDNEEEEKKTLEENEETKEELTEKEEVKTVDAKNVESNMVSDSIDVNSVDEDKDKEETIIKEEKIEEPEEIEEKTEETNVIKNTIVTLDTTDTGLKETREEEYKTVISGKSYVGGIIGFGGELSTNSHIAVNIVDCTIDNILIKGLSDVVETIGKNSESSTLVDIITNFININSLIKLIQ